MAKDRVTKLDPQTGELIVTDTGKNVRTGEDEFDRWSVPAAQLERHMPMFASSLSPGDRSAAQDIISERKKRERG